MSDEVTYVGGQAVEQQEAQDSQVPADDREAAIKAVKEAIGKAKAEGGESGEDSDSEEKKPEKSKEDAKKAEPVDEDEAALKSVLKNRQKLAAQKAKQQEEFQRQQSEVRQAWAAVEQQKRAVQHQLEQLKALKNDPARAVREAGWDPEEFVLSLAKEGTEEGKVARLIRQQQQELEAMKSWKQELLTAQQQQQLQAQQQQAVAYRDSIEKQFLGHAMNEDKCPHLSNFYEGNEHVLCSLGDKVAMQYRELTGKEASVEDIAEYLEEQLAGRANSWYEKSKSKKDTAPKTLGKPTKSTGKTLTASETSQRRTLEKDVEDLDGDERLARAKEAVKMAIAASKTAQA